MSDSISKICTISLNKKTTQIESRIFAKYLIDFGKIKNVI